MKSSWKSKPGFKKKLMRNGKSFSHVRVNSESLKTGYRATRMFE